MSTNPVKKYYEYFNKKDIDGILSLVTDDVINDANQGDSVTGKEALKKAIETAWEYFDEQVSNLDLMVNADGSNVASEYVVNGTYYKTKPGLFPSTNQHYEIIATAVFKIRDGKISRITRYYNTKKWLDIVNPNRD